MMLRTAAIQKSTIYVDDHDGENLELWMDADTPDLESSSAMDRLSLAALALVDDGIEPTFGTEPLNA
ncbi:hypothetical protein [Acidithiobacillus thiooxidans]|uniref:hypothetical protein n=1 Tax=Acidithiobacillus thiooxidans TaxID=930 RepID=UPI001C07DE6A|nr:hypothetical protein [Acidithiobacillus thiooxidans]MBU2843689.1 hypothetical protein [Acidithiobacillus thiooxidans]